MFDSLFGLHFKFVDVPISQWPRSSITMQLFFRGRRITNKSVSRNQGFTDEVKGC